jgi:hypothetical protein
VFLKWCGGEIRNHETEAKPVNIGGGNAAGAIPNFFSNLYNFNNTATMMKRE